MIKMEIHHHTTSTMRVNGVHIHQPHQHGQHHTNGNKKESNFANLQLPNANQNHIVGIVGIDGAKKK